MFTHRLLLPCLYFVIVLIVLPIFTSDKAYSLFYQDDAERNAEIDLAKNEFRKTKVHRYFADIDRKASLEFHDSRLSSPVDNLVVILAKKPRRPEDHLLLQLVAEVDRNIRSERFSRTAFFVCNVTRENFAELDAVSAVFPVRQALNTTRWRLFNREEVLKHDFVECVTHALSLTPAAAHLTLLRDHVLPYEGFLRVLNRVLATRLNGSLRRGELRPLSEEDASWLFLHLHEPTPFRHYQLSLSSVGELVAIGVAGGAAFVLLSRWVEAGSRPQPPAGVRLSYFLYGALYCLTFALVIGRPYVTELRRLLPEFYRLYDPPEAVHFSALSLPAHSAHRLLDALKDVQCSVYVPFHKVLQHMVNTIERPAYVISPSLVKYVART